MRLRYKGTPWHAWSHGVSLGLPRPPHTLLPAAQLFSADSFALLDASGKKPTWSLGRSTRARCSFGLSNSGPPNTFHVRAKGMRPIPGHTLGPHSLASPLPDEALCWVWACGWCCRRCSLTHSCAYEASTGLREQNKADHLSPSCRSKEKTHISIHSVMRQHQPGRCAVRTEKLNRQDLFFCCMRPWEAVNGHGY